mmetsp:Transcript_42815/g.84388  ORF Transcript_42815/g.84388 Transcript_42815/m.84388 type:complete len:236 (-) Transcript_42815:628-1335(-)
MRQRRRARANTAPVVTAGAFLWLVRAQNQLVAASSCCCSCCEGQSLLQRPANDVGVASAAVGRGPPRRGRVLCVKPVAPCCPFGGRGGQGSGVLAWSDTQSFRGGGGVGTHRATCVVRGPDATPARRRAPHSRCRGRQGRGTPRGALLRGAAAAAVLSRCHRCVRCRRSRVRSSRTAPATRAAPRERACSATRRRRSRRRRGRPHTRRFFCCWRAVKRYGQTASSRRTSWCSGHR